MKIITFVFKSLWWIISGVFGIIFNMLSKKPKYILYENSFLEQNNIEHEIFTDEDLVSAIELYEPNIIFLKLEEDGEITGEMYYNERLTMDKELQVVKFDSIQYLIDNINKWTRIDKRKVEANMANYGMIKQNTFCTIEVL